MIKIYSWCIGTIKIHQILSEMTAKKNNKTKNVHIQFVLRVSKIRPYSTTVLIYALLNNNSLDPPEINHRRKGTCLDAGVLGMSAMKLLTHLPAGHDHLVPFPFRCRRRSPSKTGLFWDTSQAA